MYKQNLKIEIFSDGANLDQINRLANGELISGITTNPTLMRKAGVTNYLEFCRQATKFANHKPISLEVFADEESEMYKQSKILASISDNVCIKIPITNSKGKPTYDLIKKLGEEGICVNVTGLLSRCQIKNAINSVSRNIKSYLSIFAGRIADTGVDPLPIVKEAVDLAKEENDKIKFIWASTREVFNVYQAESVGCHIITCTPDIIKKLKLYKKNLDSLSLETVKMFYEDALISGYSLD